MSERHLTVGSRYYRLRKLYHVRAVVDEEYIVVRTWKKRTGQWFYGVEEIALIEYMLSTGTAIGFEAKRKEGKVKNGSATVA